MKRFMLFYGDKYYPCGGFGDFKGSFDTEIEASKALNQCDAFDWAHIVDATNGKIVFSC